MQPHESGAVLFLNYPLTVNHRNLQKGGTGYEKNNYRSYLRSSLHNSYRTILQGIKLSAFIGTKAERHVLFGTF